MDWLLRFLLGLPARKIDIEEIRKTIPELFNQDKEILNINLKKQKYIYHILFEYPESEHFLNSIKDWMNNVEINEKINTDISCNKNNCPYRTDSNSNKSDDFPLFFELIASGMPNRKEPKAEFFDLVKKVHKNTKKIKEVIITDPYIYSDTGESGKTGGYNCTVEYLQALGISRDDNFTLKVNPSPKNFKEQSRPIFERVLTEAFPNIICDRFSPKYTFHDRLYLIKDGSGKLKGVFGPSLNGLTTNSIVLMGEIDNTNTLKRLEEVFG